MAGIRVGTIPFGTPALAGAGGDPDRRTRAGTCASATPWPESVRADLIFPGSCVQNLTKQCTPRVPASSFPLSMSSWNRCVASFIVADSKDSEVEIRHPDVFFTRTIIEDHDFYVGGQVRA